jgi:hypothetical protein
MGNRTQKLVTKNTKKFFMLTRVCFSKRGRPTAKTAEQATHFVVFPPFLENQVENWHLIHLVFGRLVGYLESNVGAAFARNTVLAGTSGGRVIKKMQRSAQVI